MALSVFNRLFIWCQDAWRLLNAVGYSYSAATQPMHRDWVRAYIVHTLTQYLLTLPTREPRVLDIEA